MGTLTVTEFITLDGVAQAPSHPDEDTENGFRFGGWQAPLESPENDGVVFEEAQRTDALLLGRKTYDIFAGYWPFAPEVRVSSHIPGQSLTMEILQTLEIDDSFTRRSERL